MGKTLAKVVDICNEHMQKHAYSTRWKAELPCKSQFNKLFETNSSTLK